MLGKSWDFKQKNGVFEQKKSGIWKHKTRLVRDGIVVLVIVNGF